MHPAVFEELRIPVDNTSLLGDLVIPKDSNAIVVFSHGSGSSRFSQRNRMVAEYLHQHQLGTLLFDLLTEREDQVYENRFDIELLTKRLVHVTNWLEQLSITRGCRIGYFGASTGAASALKAASELDEIKAVVSRGGRPDLAMENLDQVTAPTLLIVGGLDEQVRQLNEQALQRLAGEKKLVIVPGASHLFPESGKMEQVCKLAAEWFEKYLQPVTV